jgi:hypothetical protein
LTPSVCGDADESTKETAKEARECFAKGEIELAQRRLLGKNGNWGTLEYLAIKRRNIRVPTVHGNRWLPPITQNALVYPK